MKTKYFFLSIILTLSTFISQRVSADRRAEGDLVMRIMCTSAIAGVANQVYLDTARFETPVISADVDPQLLKFFETHRDQQKSSTEIMQLFESIQAARSDATTACLAMAENLMGHCFTAELSSEESLACTTKEMSAQRTIKPSAEQDRQALAALLMRPTTNEKSMHLARSITDVLYWPATYINEKLKGLGGILGENLGVVALIAILMQVLVGVGVIGFVVYVILKKRQK